MNRMISRAVVVGALILVVLAAAPVSAKNGFYIGGSFGQTSLKATDLDLDIDQFDYKADTTSYKILAGYRFMGFFAVEASYVSFGKLSDTFSGEGQTVDVETDLKGYDAFAVGMIPIKIVDIFAKIGIASWNADIRAAYDEITDFSSDSGTDLVYGLGAQVRFAGFAVRGEVEFFDIADADSVYLISLGATYTF